VAIDPCVAHMVCSLLNPDLPFDEFDGHFLFKCQIDEAYVKEEYLALYLFTPLFPLVIPFSLPSFLFDGNKGIGMAKILSHKQDTLRPIFLFWGLKILLMLLIKK
jgi:hypothetical protein